MQNLRLNLDDLFASEKVLSVMTILLSTLSHPPYNKTVLFWYNTASKRHVDAFVNDWEWKFKQKRINFQLYKGYPNKVWYWFDIGKDARYFSNNHRFYCVVDEKNEMISAIRYFSYIVNYMNRG